MASKTSDEKKQVDVIIYRPVSTESWDAIIDKKAEMSKALKRDVPYHEVLNKIIKEWKRSTQAPAKSEL